MPPRSCMFVQVQGWSCFSSLGPGSEPRQALSRLKTSTLATLSCLLQDRLSCHFYCHWSWQGFWSLDCFCCHCCAGLCIVTCYDWIGGSRAEHSHSYHFLAPYWDPTQATTEQKCSSKNRSGIQTLELFRNINFSSGHQKSWSVIGCWVYHCTDPILFLSDHLAWGKGWLTGAISFYSHSDLISETLLLFLPLGLDQSHLCPSWQMSLT